MNTIFSAIGYFVIAIGLVLTLFDGRRQQKDARKKGLLILFLFCSSLSYGQTTPGNYPTYDTFQNRDREIEFINLSDMAREIIVLRARLDSLIRELRHESREGHSIEEVGFSPDHPAGLRLNFLDDDGRFPVSCNDSEEYLILPRSLYGMGDTYQSHPIHWSHDPILFPTFPDSASTPVRIARNDAFDAQVYYSEDADSNRWTESDTVQVCRNISDTRKKGWTAQPWAAILWECPDGTYLDLKRRPLKAWIKVWEN